MIIEIACLLNNWILVEISEIIKYTNNQIIVAENLKDARIGSSRNFALKCGKNGYKPK